MHAHVSGADPGRFEEIDANPAPVRRRQMAELLLALLLLGGVCGFGLWDWLHQALQAGAYRTGKAAVVSRHWEAAQTAFARAGDYGDAPVQLHNATVQVDQLATLYPQLETAARDGAWLRAWHLAHAVDAIQGDYRDIARQVASADAALFGQGAAGLIFLVSAGPQPGLYWRTAGGLTTYLPNTTATSRVLAVSPDGTRVVYDVVLPPADLGSGVCQNSKADAKLSVPQPRLAYAMLDGAGLPAPQLLPPAFDPQGSAWLSPDGLWASAAGGRIAHYDFTRGAITGDFPLVRAARVLGAVAPAGSLLVAVLEPDASGASLRLTLVAPDGHATPGARLPGFLLLGTLSPDGRYATVLAEEVDSGIARSLYLVDTAQVVAAPHLLDRIAWQGVQLAAQLEAVFVPETPVRTLVVEHKDALGLQIRRYALPDGTPTELWYGDDAIQRDERLGASADGQGTAFRAQLDGRARLVWVPLQPAVPAAVLPVDAVLGQMIDASFAPRGDYAVFRVRNPAGLDQGTTEDIYTLPVPPAGAQAPRYLTSIARVYDPAYPTLALPAGGAVFAYVAPGNILHARTLDGAADTVLAPDVAAVWALPAP